MERICAWCGNKIGEIVSNNPEAFPVTHGICDQCAHNLFSQLGKSLYHFLDRFNVPILLIESESKVYTANKEAQKLLGKDLPEIEGKKGGNVIECAYADLPGGCGNTIHCKSCTIRNTVLETFATGKGFSKVSAYPDINVDKKRKQMIIEISTEKVGNFVLLRIDEFNESEKKSHKKSTPSEFLDTEIHLDNIYKVSQ